MSMAKGLYLCTGAGRRTHEAAEDREGRTRDGQIANEFVCIGGVEPVDQVGGREFSADDGGHIERLVRVKGPGQLQWRCLVQLRVDADRRFVQGGGRHVVTGGKGLSSLGVTTIPDFLPLY